MEITDKNLFKIAMSNCLNQYTLARVQLSEPYYSGTPELREKLVGYMEYINDYGWTKAKLMLETL